jgi:hypothetical protein
LKGFGKTKTYWVTDLIGGLSLIVLFLIILLFGEDAISWVVNIFK